MVRLEAVLTCMWCALQRVRAVLTSLYAKAATLDALLKAKDVNSDGVLSYDEFRKLTLEQQSSGLSKWTPRGYDKLDVVIEKVVHTTTCCYQLLAAFCHQSPQNQLALRGHEDFLWQQLLEATRGLQVESRPMGPGGNPEADDSVGEYVPNDSHVALVAMYKNNEHLCHSITQARIESAVTWACDLRSLQAIEVKRCSLTFRFRFMD